MQIVRDLAGGAGKPPTMDLEYNGDLAVDSVTKRYKGSFVKVMDFDDVDHGSFLTFGGLATAMENTFGILEEEQPITGNYLPDDATYGMARRRITPILQTSVIRAEYGQTDAAGSATTDTSATCTAAAAAFTVTITTNDYMIGGWIYMVTGDAAGELHYITNNTTTVATLATAVTNAVVSADTYLVISPPQERLIDFDATYTGIKSEIADTARGDAILGIATWITAPGIGLTRLDRDKHDGLVISNARFYHDFILPNSVLSDGLATS